MSAQTVVSISGVFIYTIPTQLTATWFADHEVSTATSIALTSTTFASAIGFLIPPFIIRNKVDTIKVDFLTMFISEAIISFLVFIATLIFFDEKPKFAPSLAQQKIELNNSKVNYFEVLKQLLKNCNYNLILIAFGVSKGIQDAICSNLGEIILNTFPDYTDYAGVFGLLSTVAAVPGSIVCGLSLLILGLFEGSVSPLGFEFATECTYPLTAVNMFYVCNVQCLLTRTAFTVNPELHLINVYFTCRRLMSES
ncbi:putative MFS-type transporter C09D4.1-like protein [Leptotrombidium deliense]|uniref:Putative MFS-type transporter C09D4.1-like protein n=1 Tax=Leptotrombidium deliense TaxID=299467 RepID=A0A443SBQ6_9ACAR|nr:putative MFS-type transporter C09D4.1-like protein [Leptotrombidium deliense]